VLEAARANGVKRVVFASSAAIYGDNPELPKREEMLPEPMSPYAVAKITGEYYLRTYAELYGLECVALRYFNVYGPRQDPSSPYSGVISIFATRVSQELPITIYGDGEQTRDFVNVADVVSANLLAMETDFVATKEHTRSEADSESRQRSGKEAQDADQPSTIPKRSADNFPQGNSDEGAVHHQLQNRNFLALNVATGQARSLLELLDTLEEITGHKVERTFVPARAGDIKHSLASNENLQTLGWNPSVNLSMGLARLVSSLPKA